MNEGLRDRFELIRGDKNSRLIIQCKDCGWLVWAISPEVLEHYPIAARALAWIAMQTLPLRHKHQT